MNFELGDTQHVLDSLSRIGNTHAHAGRWALAAKLLSASLALHEEAGLMVAPLSEAKARGDARGSSTTQLDEATFSEAWEQGRQLTLDEAVALALGD